MQGPSPAIQFMGNFSYVVWKNLFITYLVIVLLIPIFRQGAQNCHRATCFHESLPARAAERPTVAAPVHLRLLHVLVLSSSVNEDHPFPCI